MLIDFTKLDGIIPQEGSVTLTIRRGKEGSLSGIFQRKSPLIKVSQTYEKSLQDDKKSIEDASTMLDKVVPFKGKPAELNESFEKGIMEYAQSVTKFEEVVNNKIVELNEAIKTLEAAKKVPKKPGASSVTSSKSVSAPANGAGASVEKKDGAEQSGSLELFGPTVSTGKKEGETIDSKEGVE